MTGFVFMLQMNLLFQGLKRRRSNITRYFCISVLNSNCRVVDMFRAQSRNFIGSIQSANIFLFDSLAVKFLWLPFADEE
jgi:hypothetical protein